MPPSFVFVLAWILSIGFTLLIGAGVITYIRRTWQLIRADSDGSAQERILDGVDQLQSQLYAISDRLDRLESRLEPADSARRNELPPATDT